jgi:choline-glycine betaine transporter
MVRTITLLGLLAVFMTASPALRESAGNVASEAQFCLLAYSPYSYVLAAAATLGIMVYLARSVFARR